MLLIELLDVTKEFSVKHQIFKALNPTTLKINEGEIFGIVGYSGAGKSTLLRCLNLLETPTSGKILVDEVDILSLSKDELRKYRQKVGMIFQQFNLINAKTVAENIAFNLKAAGKDKDFIAKRIDELLSLVGLEDKKNAYPKELSGGQKQRVGIAKALANNPKILLCDEATSALDPVTTKQILQLLKEINHKFKITIILVTHEMEVIKQICDRVAVMEKGTIIEQNTVYEVFANPKTNLMKEFIDNLNDEAYIENYSGNHKVIKIIFKGKHSDEPLVHNLAVKHHIAINILSGKIEYIQNKPLGTLQIGLIGEIANCEAFIKEIKTLDSNLEVIVYD